MAARFPDRVPHFLLASLHMKYTEEDRDFARELQEKDPVLFSPSYKRMYVFSAETLTYPLTNCGDSFESNIVTREVGWESYCSCPHSESSSDS